MKRLARLLPATALLAAACVVTTREARPPPPPPPPPPTLSPAEAVERGRAFCQQRGYYCADPAVERAGDSWRVRFAADSPRAQGPLYLDYDLRTGALTAVEEPPPRLPPPSMPPAWHPPAPAPFAPRRMTREEAIDSSFNFCGERGWACRLRGAGLDGDLWRVELEARRGGAFGPMLLAYDSRSHGLVSAQEPRIPPPPPPPPPQPPPQPPQPHPMTMQEAMALGNGYCAERGWSCRLQGTALTGGYWELDYDARGRDAAGHVRIELDALRRRVTRVEGPPRPGGPAPVPAPQPPPAPAPLPGPPPAPAPRPPPVGAQIIPEGRAREVALDWCRARGQRCAARDAHLIRDGRVWRVQVEEAPPGRRKAHVDVDAASGVLVGGMQENHGEGHDEDGPPGPGHDR